MGARYIIMVTCPECVQVEEGYYAPTCGFVDHRCTQCGHRTDLETLTGISYQQASNIHKIKSVINKLKEKNEQLQSPKDGQKI
jgi:hypothetical protein